MRSCAAASAPPGSRPRAPTTGRRAGAAGRGCCASSRRPGDAARRIPLRALTSAVTYSRRGARRAAAPKAHGVTAVLLATAAAAEGSPAATLSWEGGTLLGRLLDQLAGVDVRSAHVIARPEVAIELGSAPAGLSVRVHGSHGAAADLRIVAQLARAAPGALVIASADTVTQREVLAGLLADPRVATGILSTVRPLGWPFGYRTRVRRGRVMAAASPYHRVAAPNGTFLGVLKVAAADRERLAEVAERLAGILEPGVPAAWQEELTAKGERWRRMLVRRAFKRAGVEPPEREALDTVALSPEDEAELVRRVAAAPEDIAALLLVGLVRAGVHVATESLRRLFWPRPLSEGAIERARERIAGHDEERALLNASVKPADGFFTTFFVSPYSKYIARWAARRGLTPNQVTLTSAAIGALAAAAFATAHRPGLVAGAILLQAAFTLDCVDGQLARYTRTFSSFGAWLDSIFDRGKEYLVFTGLALGAGRAGDPLWLLAGSALALQTMRHAIDFSYPVTQHQLIATRPQPPIEATSEGRRQAEPEDDPSDEDVPETDAPETDAPETGPPPVALGRRFRAAWRAGDRSAKVVWAKKVIAFPIGERFALISLTAALFSPRVTFIALLAWGGFAAGYVLIGRALRSLPA